MNGNGKAHPAPIEQGQKSSYEAKRDEPNKVSRLEFGVEMQASEYHTAEQYSGERPACTLRKKRQHTQPHCILFSERYADAGNNEVQRKHYPKRFSRGSNEELN